MVDGQPGYLGADAPKRVEKDSSIRTDIATILNPKMEGDIVWDRTATREPVPSNHARVLLKRTLFSTPFPEMQLIRFIYKRQKLSISFVLKINISRVHIPAINVRKKPV